MRPYVYTHRVKRAKIVMRYLSMVARRLDLCGVEIVVHLNKGVPGTPRCTFNGWSVVPCLFDNCEEVVSNRLTRLLRMRHGFGCVSAYFKSSRLDNLSITNRIRPSEVDALAVMMEA